MEEDQQEVIENPNYKYQQPSILPINPFIFISKLISLQTEILSTCVVNVASPFFTILSLPFRRRQSDPLNDELESGRSGGGISLLFRRIGVGMLAAAYVCAVLMVVLVVAAVAGVGLVRIWVEEPVYVKERLLFDYTDAHPTAVYYFDKFGAVPVEHTLYVSLSLLLPDSDYNRDVGIFQLAAEIVSTEGKLVAKSSHPCMLHFRSWPIRLVRTFLMGIPLLLGITSETQTITFPILRHKESIHRRTEQVRIILYPRAGTLYLPQFYDAEILLRSRAPLIKEIIYRWRWTLYVWTTFYIFLFLVMFLVLFLKPLILPVIAVSYGKNERDVSLEFGQRRRDAEERDVSETLRRLQLSRKKRKAELLNRIMDESCASSITVDRSEGFEECSGDSEIINF